VKKNLATGNYDVLYTNPVNHTFYLTATTSGLVIAYLPIYVNIYHCGQVHINITDKLPKDSMKQWLNFTDMPHLVLNISMHNRTLTPIYYKDFLVRFTDNDTVNCPVLPGTLKIDKVVDAVTGKIVPITTWSKVFTVT